jgi:hypothetical protein
MSKEKIDERMLKFKLHQGIKHAFTEPPAEKQNVEQEKNEFAPKTMDFI